MKRQIWEFVGALIIVAGAAVGWLILSAPGKNGAAGDAGAGAAAARRPLRGARGACLRRLPGIGGRARPLRGADVGVGGWRDGGAKQELACESK